MCGHWGGAYDGGMLVVFREVVLWGVAAVLLYLLVKTVREFWNE